MSIQTPLSYFMGYEVIYHPDSMDYSVLGPKGQSVKFDRYTMENDNDYMATIVDVVNSWNSANPGATHKRHKIDLRDVSTSDLLNEAFRRGAIKQLTMKRAVSKYQIDEYGDDFMKHVHTKLRYDALASRADELEKAGVFNVGKREGGPHPYDDVEFSVDYFICKHPLTLKKEEGRVD